MNLLVERRQILVGGRLLSCLASGTPESGRLVVFLHAFPLNAGMWRPQLAALPTGWAGLAPDFRGFGASEPDGASQGRRTDVRMEDYAADVAGALDALGAARAAFCGCSMGGYAALAVLREFPQRVAGMFLADTRATADGEAARTGRRVMLETLDRGGPAAVAGDMRLRLVGPTSHAGRPGVLAAIDGMMREATESGIGHAIIRMLNRPPAMAALAAFHGPVTVAVGEEDVLTPPEEAASMAAAVPGSELVVIPAAGHLPNLEAPEAFSVALGEFLARVEPALA